MTDQFYLLLPAIIVPIISLGILIVLFILVFRWVNIIIFLKKEQNELLREIIKRLENK